MICDATVHVTIREQCISIGYSLMYVISSLGAQSFPDCDDLYGCALQLL
jgi:hypothetical protein